MSQIYKNLYVFLQYLTFLRTTLSVKQQKLVRVLHLGSHAPNGQRAHRIPGPYIPGSRELRPPGLVIESMTTRMNDGDRLRMVDEAGAGFE